MRRWLLVLLGLTTTLGCLPTDGQIARNVLLPEQRTIDYRDPAALPAIPLPEFEAPRTVSNLQPETPQWQMSLDEAIRIALENARVIRVLTGLSASASGQTIYDTAITNTTIDQEQGRFSPIASQRSTFTRVETPFAVFDFTNGAGRIGGTSTNTFRSDVGLTKTNVLGGQWSLSWVEEPTRFGGAASSILNPQNRDSLEMSYTQPLLQGGGYLVNTAPIVIARLNTERSYFQYKDSVQELVRGVIEAYWNLVLARTELWARKIQVQQSEEAYEREKARLQTGLTDLGSVSQARVTYNQFRANLIDAQSSVLAREGALRNILFLPPEDHRQIIPVSPPTSKRLKPEWEGLVRLAEARRPDIVELKLVLEADQVRLYQARNQALPRLDGVMLYRWNGLHGTLPNREEVRTGAGEFTDWSLGINFSVPLGFRQERARIREQTLLLDRDRANLQQRFHATIHDLAITMRGLDSAYEQYLAFKETRAAAFANLQVQIEQFRARRNIYLNVLQALNDWGNSVTSEARALLTYNVALATLERQTGTMLETHGLYFREERFRAAGPLGLPGHRPLYPEALVPEGSPNRYPGGTQPAENSFDLQNPDPRTPRKPEELPRPTPVPSGPDAPPPVPEKEKPPTPPRSMPAGPKLPGAR